MHFGAPQLLVGISVALLVAVVLLIVLADGLAGFVAVTALTLLGAVGTAVATGFDLRPAATAGVIAAVGLAFSPFLPTLSFRLSRLPLPVIPLDAADLRRDTGTVDARQILGQAVRADQFLTGLVGGVSLAIAGSAAVMAGQGVSEEILAVVLGVICMLRARLFTGRGQRVLLLVSGGVALAAEVVAGSVDAHGTVRLLAFAVPAALVGLVLVGLTVVLPGRRYAPPVARAADVIESLLVLSVIPLALGVMGVYGAVRQLAKLTGPGRFSAPRPAAGPRPRSGSARRTRCVRVAAPRRTSRPAGPGTRPSGSGSRRHAPRSARIPRAAPRKL